MNHKAGDTVRIRSKEWIDAQEKNKDGNIYSFVKPMHIYAGRIAKIVTVSNGGDCFMLDIDNGEWRWAEKMFDPDYRPEDEPLSVKDAVLAMLDGETLYDEDGRRAIFNAEEGWFEYEGAEGDGLISEVFKGLSRRLPKRKRPMTRWEILAWANSEDAREWVARTEIGDVWYSPQALNYSLDEYEYQRARLLPDHSGIDEDMIQGFEVEE